MVTKCAGTDKFVTYLNPCAMCKDSSSMLLCNFEHISSKPVAVLYILRSVPCFMYDPLLLIDSSCAVLRLIVKE